MGTFNDPWIRTDITETLQLEQVGTKFRAGSTRAQRNQLPGVTTHSYHSPQPVKNSTLLNRRGPPELFKRRPSSKEHEIQNQSPDIQKTLLGQSPKSLLGKSRATAPKAIQRGQGQWKNCGSRLVRSAQGSKGTGKAVRKRCPRPQNPTRQTDRPLAKADLSLQRVVGHLCLVDALVSRTQASSASAGWVWPPLPPPLAFFFAAGFALGWPGLASVKELLPNAPCRL